MSAVGGSPPEDSRLGKLFSSERSKAERPGDTRWQKFTDIFKSAAGKRQAGAERTGRRAFRAEVWEAHQHGGAIKAWEVVKSRSLDNSYYFPIAEESKKFTPAGREALSMHRAAVQDARDQQESRSLKTWLGQIDDDYEKLRFLAQEGYTTTTESFSTVDEYDNTESTETREVTVEKPGAAAKEARTLCSNIMRSSRAQYGLNYYIPRKGIQDQRTEAANSISSQVEESGVNQLDRDTLNSHIRALEIAPRPYQYLPAIKQLEDQLAIATVSYEKEQAQSAQTQLMERTGGQNTKESMYPLSITDIDGYLEKLRPYPQDDATVTALQECRTEKVGILSQVDRILGSRLAGGATLHLRWSHREYTVSQCRAALALLDNPSLLPEHREAVAVFRGKVLKYDNFMARWSEAKKKPFGVYSAFSLPEMNEFRAFMEFEQEPDFKRVLNYYMQNKQKAFDGFNAVSGLFITPDHPMIGESEAQYMRKDRCLKALEILQDNVQIPECSRVNIPILKARLAEIKKHETRGEEEARRSRESQATSTSVSATANMSTHVENFFRDNNVNFPKADDGSYIIATESDCVAQANCFRECLIALKILPEDRFPEPITNLTSARSFARRVTRSVHPDTAKIKKDDSQVLLEIALIISGNVEAIRLRNR